MQKSGIPARLYPMDWQDAKRIASKQNTPSCKGCHCPAYSFKIIGKPGNNPNKSLFSP
jgi:hypothetical protein